MTAQTTGRRRPRASSSKPGERSVEARLARVHLRGGMIALARAELEALVAQGAMDTQALADLAEARWRNGDLTGAGAAAAAHLDEGGKDAIALAVAAEALAARGRTAEARAHAKRLLAALPGPSSGEVLEAIFAGQPRGAIWPDAEVEPVSGPQPSGPDPSGPDAAFPDSGASLDGEVDAPRPVGPDLVAEVEAAIAAGRVRDVAVRLTIILREEGALAPLVLSLADRALAVAATPPVAASLQLVRGDAFRSLGREIEASAAFQAARRVLEATATSEADR
jgi:hypothetical protein